MQTFNRSTRMLGLLICSGLVAMPHVAWAADAAMPALVPASAPSIAARCECRPVDDQTLDRLRGGFDDGRGLVVSIGVERLTVVNGVTVATANLHISDLSKVSAQQVQQLQNTLAALQITNGAANVNTSLQGASAGSTFIQNTLNNQNIRNATVLNVSTNSQQALKAANLQSTLQDALSQSLVRH